MKPAGATSVMADRARGEVEADSDQVALWRMLEYFPTPPWAARAGGELIARLDPGCWTCWEPACGQGHMAHGLAAYFAQVHPTDIHDHGWEGQRAVCDFTSWAYADTVVSDWIVTNPPFGVAAEFVRLGMQRARRGVAILARTTWLESVDRYSLFFGPDAHLTVFAPFFERVPMTLGRWDPKASSATAYAWFIFMQPGALADASRTTGRLFGPDPMVWGIPPGTKARLTNPDDARLFGVKGATPLFDGGVEP
jgi:hypothetical protein